MKTFVSGLIAVTLAGVTHSLNAVDYGGERSHLFEIPYKACAIAPLPEDAAKAGIVAITTKKAKQLFDEGAYFYDARRRAHYLKGHIKGAKEVLFDVSKAKYTVLELPKDKKHSLVFYCYGESCASSYEAALAVKALDYQNVYWYSTGYAGWIGKNYPVDK